MAKILTGVQSTGTPHLGNLLGAIITSYYKWLIILPMNRFYLLPICIRLPKLKMEPN